MGISELPKDPIMLLSYINTRMRDDRVTFDELLLELNISSEKEAILKKLENVGYTYNEELNKFI